MFKKKVKLTGFFFLVTIIMILTMLPIFPEKIEAKNTALENFKSTAVSDYSSFFTEDLLEKTNAARKKNDIGELMMEERLQAAAQKKAENMAKNNYFAHTAPSGKTPWQWLDEEGYAYQSAGENLAVNFEDSTELVEGWMNSPKHKQNLLNGNFNKVGVGIAYGTYTGQKAAYVVEFYAQEKETFLSNSLLGRLIAMF